MLVLWVWDRTEVNFLKPNSKYNTDKFKMIIKIFHSFLNRNINIIMDNN